MKKEINCEENNIPKHKIKYFTLGIIIGFIIVVISVLMQNNNNLMSIGLMTMGITITIFPFCTPDTIKLVGYKKSKIIGRILGLVLILISLWIKIG